MFAGCSGLLDTAEPPRIPARRSLPSSMELSSQQCVMPSYPVALKLGLDSEIRDVDCEREKLKRTMRNFGH